MVSKRVHSNAHSVSTTQRRERDHAMEKGRERVSKFASINFITKVPFRRNLSTRMRNFLNRLLRLPYSLRYARVPLEEALNNVLYSIDRFILGDSQTYGLVDCPTGRLEDSSRLLANGRQAAVCTAARRAHRHVTNSNVKVHTSASCVIEATEAPAPYAMLVLFPPTPPQIDLPPQHTHMR